MKRPKMTIEDLAELMEKGFRGIARQFEAIDKRFDQVDEQFVSVRRDIMGQNDKFPSSYAFDQLAGRISTLEDSAKKKE